MAGSIGALAFLRLPETLPIDRRVPFHPAGAGKVLFAALANIRFVDYTAVFGLIASAQLVFGVVAPFLYQQNLGLSAGAHGLIALLIGGANLAGEVACTSLATRTSPRQLCFGALSVYLLGTLLLLLSGLLLGASFFPITLGGMLALAGCGTLCPTMYGMALAFLQKSGIARRFHWLALLPCGKRDYGLGRLSAGNLPGAARLGLSGDWHDRRPSARHFPSRRGNLLVPLVSRSGLCFCSRQHYPGPDLQNLRFTF